jgi:hypothetical protein
MESSNNESSVAFNLENLMQLEQERVAAEQAALRAEREAQAKQEREREREREQEREEQRTREARRVEETRRAHDDEAAVTLALRREAALREVRADVEARERVEQRRLSLEHERKLQAMQVEARGAWWARTLGATCVVLVLAGGAAYAVQLKPALQAARAELSRERGVAEARARELNALRREVAERRASGTTTSAHTSAVSTVRATPLTAAGSDARPPVKPKTRPVVRKVPPAGPPPDDGLGEDSTDPLGDLAGSEAHGRKPHR